MATLKYKGKSRSESTKFLISLKGRFYTYADDFTTDALKVMYASAGFENPAARQWTKYLALEKNSDPTKVTWLEFETWLQAGIGDQGTRSLLSYPRLESIQQQQPGEMFAAFLEKFEAAEAEDPDEKPERIQIMRLLLGLTDHLRAEIMRRRLPETRQQLIADAQRAELVTGAIQSRTFSERLPKPNPVAPTQSPAVNPPAARRAHPRKQEGRNDRPAPIK